MGKGHILAQTPSKPDRWIATVERKTVGGGETKMVRGSDEEQKTNGSMETEEQSVPDKNTVSYSCKSQTVVSQAVESVSRSQVSIF